MRAYYRACDVCMVTSLHDGMNLVAKEFVAARDDERGVLILSQFAGASRELPEALIVNPYHIEEMAPSAAPRADDAAGRAARAHGEPARDGARIQRLPLGRPHAGRCGEVAPARALRRARWRQRRDVIGARTRLQESSRAATMGMSKPRIKPLSSPEGQEALRGLSLASALYAFDFDGTLAPIVSRPDAARLSSDVEQRLARLAQSELVAVVSGRSLDDLRLRIPGEVRHLIGNHGSEGTGGAVDTEAMRHVCRAWLAQLKSPLASLQNDAGIVVEDKGLTLSLHYRLAADRTSAERSLSALALQLEPVPRVIGGKLVLNLLPPNSLTKLEALVDLARREAVDRVLFVGDDQTDELVFAQAPTHWTTVRVEPDCASRARFSIDRQSDVSALLDKLLLLLQRPTESAGP